MVISGHDLVVRGTEMRERSTEAPSEPNDHHFRVERAETQCLAIEREELHNLVSWIVAWIVQSGTECMCSRYRGVMSIIYGRILGHVG